jgi:hypothetical protein
VFKEGRHNAQLTVEKSHRNARRWLALSRNGGSQGNQLKEVKVTAGGAKCVAGLSPPQRPRTILPQRSRGSNVIKELDRYKRAKDAAKMADRAHGICP